MTRLHATIRRPLAHSALVALLAVALPADGHGQGGPDRNPWPRYPTRLQGDGAAAPAPPELPAGVGSPASTPRPVAGAVLWEERYHPARFQQAFSVVTVGDTAVVAGWVDPGTGRDGVVVGYDTATGTLRWEDRYDLGGDDFASGVATDGTRVFVSGSSERPGRGADWVLRAYDPSDGRLLWDRVFDLAGGQDVPRGTALASSDGLVFLGGYGTSAGGDRDWVVRAHDAGTGDLAWQDRRDVAGGDDGVFALTASDGRVVAGGWGDDLQGENARVRALDTRTGALLWENGTSGLPGFGLTFTRDVETAGGLVFAAQSSVLGDPLRLVSTVRAFDAATGVLRWQRDSDTGPGDFVWDLATGAGRVVAAGDGGPDCDIDCDAVVRSFDAADGTLRWERQLDLSGVSDTSDIVTIDRGTVYVHSQAASTLVLPGCCRIGQWVIHAFDGRSGETLWQSVGNRLESGVYNMVVDRGRLLVPGRLIDTTARRWDLLLRAYDVRGHASRVEQPFRHELYLEGTSGEIRADTGLDRPASPSVHGPIPADRRPGTVLDDPHDDPGAALATGIGIRVHVVSVPPGTRHLRAATFDAETDGDDDLDLYLFSPGGNLVDLSGRPGSTERVDLAEPPPGDYFVVVHGFDTDGPESEYTLFAWVLGEAETGTLGIAGVETADDGSTILTLTWSGLAAGEGHLGAISYHDASGAEIAQTRISIEN